MKAFVAYYWPGGVHNNPKIQTVPIEDAKQFQRYLQLMSNTTYNSTRAYLCENKWDA